MDKPIKIVKPFYERTGFVIGVGIVIGSLILGIVIIPHYASYDKGNLVCPAGTVLKYGICYGSETNKTEIVKPVVNYHEQSSSPTKNIKTYTIQKNIMAFNYMSQKLLLDDQSVVNIGDIPLTLWHNNVALSTSDGNSYLIDDEPEKIAGSRVILTYSVYQPTCIYLFDWGNGFSSMYNVTNFNFNQIPNATNYDFKLDANLSSCENSTELDKVEIIQK